MTRGILYYVWGNYNKKQLQNSIDTVKKFGYDYRVVVGKGEYKQYVNRVDLFDASPFDLTLHLDTDTFVKGNLDFGFDMAERWGLACCIAPASSAYYAAKTQKTDFLFSEKEIPQYNCGVLFYNKNNKRVRYVFIQYANFLRHWEKWAWENDQPYFAKAVHELGFNPYVLPKTWNFRPHLRYESNVWHGDLKIVHSRKDIT